MYSVSPKEGERFYLRLLLLHRSGAKSFEELRTVDGTLYSSFREAALAMNLLQSDEEWERCLKEASNLKMAKQMRELFAKICVFCSPIDPRKLWEDFKKFMCDDFV